jgi:hypothetical protein
MILASVYLEEMKQADSLARLCEERSDEATQIGAAALDCSASLAMTNRVH